MSRVKFRFLTGAAFEMSDPDEPRVEDFIAATCEKAYERWGSKKQVPVVAEVRPEVFRNMVDRLNARVDAVTVDLGFHLFLEEYVLLHHPAGSIVVVPRAG